MARKNTTNGNLIWEQNEERSQFILVYGNLVGFFALFASDCMCFSLIMQVAANLIQFSVLINLVLFWFKFRFMQLLACASPGFVLIFMPCKRTVYIESFLIW